MPSLPQLESEEYMQRLRKIAHQYSREQLTNSRQGILRPPTRQIDTADQYKQAVEARMPKSIPWAVDRDTFGFAVNERGGSPIHQHIRGNSRAGAPQGPNGTRRISIASPVAKAAKQIPIGYSPTSAQHPVTRAIPGYTGHLEGLKRSMGATFGNSIGRTSLPSQPLYTRQEDDFTLCRSGYPSFQTRPWEIRPDTATRARMIDPVNRMPREGVVQVVANALMARVNPKARWPMNKCLFEFRRAWISLMGEGNECMGTPKLRQILASCGVEVHEQDAEKLIAQLHLDQDPEGMLRLEVLCKALDEFHNRHPLARPKLVRPHRCFTAAAEKAAEGHGQIQPEILMRPNLYSRGNGARPEQLRLDSPMHQTQWQQQKHMVNIP